MPFGQLTGDANLANRRFASKKMAHNFRIVRVCGRVSWKYQGRERNSPGLIIKRQRETLILGELDLATVAAGSSTEEVVATFDFEPDA